MFKFKQFSISHSKSSMKVGSDSILLACWANVLSTKSVIDIGTGCGIIALILAQRNLTATIHAIDIDEPSVEEAGYNFEASPWSNRLSVQQISIQDFVLKGKKYDLLITNPPYFSNSLKVEGNKQRNFARHTDNTLPFFELVNAIATMLLPEGRFACILPVSEAENFYRESKIKGLHCCRLTKVNTTPNGNLQRYLMEFSTQKTNCIEDQFTIMNADRTYSDWYKNLTKDFYLGLP